MQTAGRFTQDKANTDGEVFLSATDFMGSGATPSQGLTAVGAANIPTIFGTVAGTFVAAASILPVMLRTGIFAPNTPQTLSGQAFGTAAGLPGPQAAVPATSGPDGFGINSISPPVLKANLPTLIGSVAGAKPKGVQINWIDFLYQSTGTVASSITGQLQQVTVPAPGNALTPVVTSIIASTALPTTLSTAGKLNRARLTVATPVMLVLDGSMYVATFSIVIAGGVSVFFAGAVVGISYNFN